MALPKVIAAHAPAECLGCGKPPKHSQFEKGQSGNATGRLKGTKNLKTDLAGELQEILLVSTSVGGSLTGRGANYIIIDDPMKPADAQSKAERKRVYDWFDCTLYSRLDNKNDDVIVLVVQRLQEDDLVGHVEDKGNWTKLRLSVIVTEDQ